MATCVVTETSPGYEFCHTHKMRAAWGLCDGRYEAWAPATIPAGTLVRLRNPNYETVGQTGTLVGEGRTGVYRVWTIDIGTQRYRNEGYIEIA